VQPPLATGYLNAELEVSAMVWGLPPWYDPLEETVVSLVNSFFDCYLFSKCNQLAGGNTSVARVMSLLTIPVV
jgi:hypothetical protein